MSRNHHYRTLHTRDYLYRLAFCVISVTILVLGMPTEQKIGHTYKLGEPWDDSPVIATDSFRIWKFGVSATFRGQAGGKIFNTYRALYENTSNLGQSNILASWLEDTSFRGKEIKYSTKYIEDASFLKLDNVSVSYDFSLKNEYLKKLRLYLTAQNLFCLTGYSGVDPEVSLSGIAPGIEGTSYYPRTRSFTFGATFTF